MANHTVVDALKLFATHRIFTGKPVSRGYVQSRLTGKIVWACPHRHRYPGAANAQKCAEKALRAILRGHTAVMGVPAFVQQHEAAQ